MNHDFAIAFEAMMTSVAEEAASEAIRQFRIEKQLCQQDGEGDRLLLRSHEAAEQLAISYQQLDNLCLPEPACPFPIVSIQAAAQDARVARSTIVAR